MADELEQFLKTRRTTHRAEIERIRRLNREIVAMYADCFLEDEKGWPYQLVNRRMPESPRGSFSTPAMIAFALGLLIGRIESSTLVPTASTVRLGEAIGPAATLERVEAMIGSALDEIAGHSTKLKASTPGDERGIPAPRWPGQLTQSSTFGWDDPFTLTWLLEVLWSDRGDTHVGFRKDLERRAKQLVSHVLKHPEEVLRIDAEERVSHAFPLLRVLQLRESLKRHGVVNETSWGDVSIARAHLFDRLHRHLSESQIPNSGFDAGELVFSLEGWILTSAFEPDLAVVQRVFDVLRESQTATPYWRPLRPFKATQQGLVLLPQSVEIANSLLRICGWPALQVQQYFSKHVELLERYTRWLVERVYRGVTAAGKPFLGWESEHTYALDRIHLWQTSQVLIYLQHYATMLEQHDARRSAELAGLAPPPAERSSAGERLAAWKTWKETEPVSRGEPQSAYRIYERIEQRFIRPRLERDEGAQGWSMLLYGPPGTGKTSIAKAVARALDLPMLTVTPSDFLTSGGELIEARAKAIFEVIQQQRNSLVLFDEIDQLLLDRDSDLYGAQGDIFKLLTPGMLTKLGDLAAARRVLFVIATNYYERIDRAIKRPGRIDARYLVLPPAREARRRYLERQIKGGSSLEDDHEVLERTVRFTYRELGDLARSVNEAGAGADTAFMLKLIEERPPMITLGSYASRLRKVAKGADPDTLPLEEFALLAYLELEARGRLPNDPSWAIPRVRDAVEQDRVLDKSVSQELKAAL
jgi:DNA replication protein DnaC